MFFAVFVMLCLAVSAFAAETRPAATEDLGNGFAHHGVATPVSNHRGIVATKDGDGRDIVLAWLMDHRGCYELLLIDAETGKKILHIKDSLAENDEVQNVYANFELPQALLAELS